MCEEMPLFMVVHKWKKEDFPVVGKKVIEVMAQLPEKMALCTSYCNADQTGAWCLWEAGSGEEIVEFLEKMVSEMSSNAKTVV
jgi:hypothetical protein